MSENIYWNTYDPLGMNRIVRFPELFEICISVYAPESKSYTSKFYFVEYKTEAGKALRAGPHTKYCEYASADLSFAGFIFRIEYACIDNNSLAVIITPIAIADPFTIILVEVKKAWKLEGEVELKDDEIISFPCNDGKYIKIYARQEFHSNDYPGDALTKGLYSDENALIEDLKESGKLNGMEGAGKIAVLGFNARIPLKIMAHFEEENKKLNVDEIIDKAKLRYEKDRMKIVGGEFEGCAKAVTSVINWCAVWDQLKAIPYTPITRAWIDLYMVGAGIDKAARGSLIGLWDNCFNAILHSIEDLKLSESNLIEILDDSSLIDGEFPPNYIVSGFVSGDRSQPPVASIALWKIYRKFGNQEFLRWAYPRLKTWHLWWKKKRDGNKDGLLEWGSHRAKKLGNNARSLYAAACESGMDNSPLYDDAEFDRKIGTMNLSDIGLNSLYTADALYLSKIANLLGLQAESEQFLKEWETMREIINENLWNDEREAYMDKYWNGEFSIRLAPTTFYPLLARIPTKERAELIIKKHLLNEEIFWGDYVIPSISRNDKAFNDQIYWRGRIWPSMNYIVYLGLKEYELDFIAYELARKSSRLFMKEWHEKGHCHENYNAITGNGDDVPTPTQPNSQGSDRYYSWGALLVLMGIEEILDVEIDEGIRFGCRFLNEKNSLSNIKLKGNEYKIEALKDETNAFRNGTNFFNSKPGTNIRNYIVDKECVKFRASGDGETVFTLQEFKPRANITVIIEEKEVKTLVADQQGVITFSSKLSKDFSSFLLKIK
ncbi:MAG: trehalase family glycosidase [Candidatus Hodarchaeota archaeon]